MSDKVRRVLLLWWWWPHAGSDSNCGECYQVQPVQSERLWRSDFKQLIVQVRAS